MRILIISALFPPYVQGGAELCAYNLAKWLLVNGHEVGILTASQKPDDRLSGEMVEGFRVWRTAIPRSYTISDATRVSSWQKPLWHLQDHLDPRNSSIMADALDEFQPELVNVHYIQGMGYNGLKEIGSRNIPTVFTLHDLGLACVKMAMFVDGKECFQLCSTCALSSKVKMSYLRSISRIGFISPSRSNLEKLCKLQPIDRYPRAHILNANRYPSPTVKPRPSEHLRLIYVGRLQETKGVNVIFDALEPLAKTYGFSLEIVGTGPEEARLRERYEKFEWVRFAGHVSVQEVTDKMAESDLLLVPSLWNENSPGVVIQALAVSLPVMGSNKGGIPELVIDGENGILVPPGNVEAWRAAIESILQDSTRLGTYRANAARRSAEFDQDTLGHKVVEFYERVIALPG